MKLLFVFFSLSNELIKKNDKSKSFISFSLLLSKIKSSLYSYMEKLPFLINILN